MSRLATRPRLAALIGLGLAMPFVMLNVIGLMRLEALYSAMMSGAAATRLGVVLLYVSVLLVGAGAVVAAWPILRTRRLHILNALLAVVLSALFVLLAVGLAEEIYRCDILDIPNCD